MFIINIKYTNRNAIPVYRELVSTVLGTNNLFLVKIDIKQFLFQLSELI